MTTTLGVLLVFIVLANAQANYNQTAAEMFVSYAGAAYCCGGLGRGVADWSCAACKTVPALENITVLYNKTHNSNGYIGYAPQLGSIILVFTGTNPLSIVNWIDDIRTLKSNYPPCSGCEVHTGFYETYLTLQQQIHNAIYLLLRGYPKARIEITGHSLGAALALFGALDVYQKFNIRPAALYTFGEPRSGNSAFSTYAMQALAPIWRVVHHKDPVPHLPFEKWNFHHVAREVFYDRKQKSYKVCDNSGEDPTCSDKYFIDGNAFDHLNYLGFDFTLNYLGCRI